MAARLNRRHQDMVRDKIRASQLINRLEEHILGDVDMSGTQVTAALGLLKKSLPDIKAIEMSGEGGGPLQIGIVDFSALTNAPDTATE